MTLYTYTATKLDLPAALRAYAAPAGTAILLYGPAKCRFGRLDAGGTVTDEAGRAIDLAPVYEARAFYDDAELRWWNDPTPARCHKAVIFREGETAVAGWKADSPAVIEAHATAYLLWGGETTPAANGWRQLATPRVGTMWVPFDGPVPQGRVWLHATEYFAEYDDGNVAVLDERLRTLKGVPNAQG